jgi:Zn-dependent protease with chaperone function
VRKLLVFAVAIIMGVPLVALVAGAVWSAEALWQGAALVLAAAIVVTAGFVGALYLLRARSEWLARCFTLVVRPTMMAVAVLLVLQGALILFALSVLLPDGGPGLWFVVMALGFGWVGVLILIEAFKPWRLNSLAVAGSLLQPQQLPDLRARIGRLAQRLGVSPPAQIILGLEPGIFVTSLPIKLRGRDPLPRAETLYLPVYALRLFSDEELDAVIGHELGHFRNADLAFTLRFAPGLRALANTAENVSPEDVDAHALGQWFRIARLPAYLLMQAMTITLIRIVNRIRRARELGADRASIEVSSPAAAASALVKGSLMALPWYQFHSANRAYLASGRARPNLSADYMARLVEGVRAADPNGIATFLLEWHIPHPVDTHPSLAERLRALRADPVQAIEAALNEMSQQAPAEEELIALEQAITAFENDWTRVPGTPIVVDELELSSSTRP